ncbi:MAG: hypothetical protein WCI77_07890 [Candidatus Omnitrophota bacterium]
MISDLSSKIHQFLEEHCVGKKYAIKAQIIADTFEVSLREVNAAARKTYRIVKRKSLRLLSSGYRRRGKRLSRHV